MTKPCGCLLRDFNLIKIKCILPENRKMNIIWDITKEDTQKMVDFINENQNVFVENRFNRNIKREHIVTDKNIILKEITMCLLTSQQRSGPNTPIGKFLRLKPFPFTVEKFEKEKNIEDFIRKTLLTNGLNRYINRITKFIIYNYTGLIHTKWELFKNIEKELNGQTTISEERKIADKIAKNLKGFGPKQARNLLQGLGLTRYEIPIDSRITNWLNKFGFPISLSSIALQDTSYYHFVSDGINELCKKVNIYPCIFDAVIFSSFDKGEWNEENVIS